MRDVVEVDDLIGAPFVYGGRGENGMYDCYGLLLELNKRQGIDLPDYRSPTESRIIAGIFLREKQLWQRCDPEPGCAVLFRVKNLFCHVGFVLDNDSFIHTWEQSGGVLIERLSDWESRIEGYYKYVA